jgi:hypothetical protein
MAIELSEAIAKLRSELAQAVERSANLSGPRLRVESLELELEVSVETNDKLDAGVKFYVVNVGGATESRSSSTNRIRVIFQPESEAGGSLYTNEALTTLPE